jgi:hypothetical protein
MMILDRSKAASSESQMCQRSFSFDWLSNRDENMIRRRNLPSKCWRYISRLCQMLVSFEDVTLVWRIIVYLTKISMVFLPCYVPRLDIIFLYKSIIWFISICTRLVRRVLDFALHRRLSSENGLFEKANWSNRFQLCGRFHNYFPIMYIHIFYRDVQDGIWSKSGY